MSSKKRLGKDPFEITPVVKEALKNEPILIVAAASPVEAEMHSTKLPEEIKNLDGLSLTEQLAIHQEKIDRLQKEVKELKNANKYNIFNFYKLWLRFWFPWFLG